MLLLGHSLLADPSPALSDFHLATLHHLALSTNFITQEHVVRDRDVEKGLVFLCFHTHVLSEAASSPGQYTNSYKTYLEHYRGSSLGEGTGWGLRTFLLPQYRK